MNFQQNNVDYFLIYNEGFDSNLFNYIKSHLVLTDDESNNFQTRCMSIAFSLQVGGYSFWVVSKGNTRINICIQRSR
jgi:hypothetical protein